MIKWKQDLKDMTDIEKLLLNVHVIIKRYFKYIRGEELEELYSIGYLTVFQSIEHYYNKPIKPGKVRGTIRTFTWKAIMNNIMNYLNKKRPVTETDIQANFEAFPWKEPDTPLPLIEQWKEHQLDLWVMLTPKQKRVFLLRKGGLTQEQIARKIGCTKANVSSILIKICMKGRRIVNAKASI